jgi:hypothetical protein
VSRYHDRRHDYKMQLERGDNGWECIDIPFTPTSITQHFQTTSCY